MRSDGPGELYIASLTDFNVSLSDQTGAHMVLCPECWLLTKAGTSFFVAEEQWGFGLFFGFSFGGSNSCSDSREGRKFISGERRKRMGFGGKM
ncbi:hypothetical protein VNO80_08185 [Phaseolus coccineus]|uniref:Uncharacterized protein n=1 Tax=Phaseolus coccineus TaxID=3886 RepID=A0AAN9RQD4_PHACN